MGKLSEGLVMSKITEEWLIGILKEQSDQAEQSNIILEDSLKSSKELLEIVTHHKEENEELKDENDALLEKLDVFNMFIKSDGLEQQFINAMKLNIEFETTSIHAREDYDWSIEKQMIEELEGKLEYVRD